MRSFKDLVMCGLACCLLSVPATAATKEPPLGKICIGTPTTAPGDGLNVDRYLYLLSEDKETVANTIPLLTKGMRIADFSGAKPLLYKRGPTRELVESLEFQSALNDPNRLGGLTQSTSDFFRFPSPNDGSLRLVLNELCITVGADWSMTLDIKAKKIYRDASVPGFRFGIWYDWGIKILPGELIGRPITRSIDGKDFNFKLHARAPHMEINHFKVGLDFNNNNLIDDYTLNGIKRPETEQVKYFFEDGTINRLASVMHPNNSDCIDIDLNFDSEAVKAVYKGGRIHAEALASALRGSLKAIQFCAGSCSGYLLAATNN